MNTKELKQLNHLLKNKSYSEAFKDVNRFIKSDPSDPEAWEHRAHILALKKDYKTAINDMTKAIALSPKEPHYFWTRG